MSTPTMNATPIAGANNVTTPGSHTSPTPLHQQSPQIPVSHSQRKEVVIVFVVDGTARMKPHFDLLYEAYVEPIIRQLRLPIVTEAEEGQPKTKITPVLKYGLVVFGDYEPFSVATVDRKYFTSDPIQFQDIFKNIPFRNGGIVKNAVGEGMVAALELFDEYKEELDGKELIQHCILLSNSLPYKMGSRCNLVDKYDGYKLVDVAAEMKKSNIRLSLISPKKACKELEDIVVQVNEQQTELNTMQETAVPSHVVKLAGFKLPVAPPPVIPMDASKNLIPGKQAIDSPHSAHSDAGKKRKRENVPGSISLPKPAFDAKNFAEASARVNAEIVNKRRSVSGIKSEDVTTEEKQATALPNDQNIALVATPPKSSPMAQNAQQIQQTPPQQAQLTSQQLQLQQAQQLQQQQQQLQQQQQQHMQSQGQQHPSPQLLQQQQQQQQAQQQQLQQQLQLQQMQQAQQQQLQQQQMQAQQQAQQVQQQQQNPQQQQQQRPPQQQPQQTIPGRMQNPHQLQQYLLQQRNNLIAQGVNLTPVQQQQLQTIQAALLKLGDQLRRSSAMGPNGVSQPPGGINTSAPPSTAAAVTAPNASPMAFAANAAAAAGGGNPNGMQVRPSTPDMSNNTNTPNNLMQNQMQQQQLNLGNMTNAQIPANLTPQQRMLIAAQLAQRNQSNPQQPGARPPNISELQAQLLQQQAQAQQAQQQAQQQVQQQQQQQAGGLNQQQLQDQSGQQGTVPTQPIWTGQIVWHIKTPEGQLQEFSCHCGAFAITLKGNSVSLDEYRPDIWPTRIQIAGRSPLSRAQILQRQAIENKLPFCQFRPLNTSSQQDQTNFTLLVRNLEQKKYIATVVFNLGANQAGGASEPHHGVVLTHTGGKLIGIVFTRVPLPDLNAGGGTTVPPNGMPPGAIPQSMASNASTPVSGSNINPAMLANLQNTANLSVLNANSNPNVQHLQNTLRQQQMMNAAGMGSPATGGAGNGQQISQQQNQQGQQQQQPNQGQPNQNMNGLNANSLLLSNINLGNNVGNNNMNNMNTNNLLGMNNINMANLANLNLQPNAVRDLQQRLFLARQQQQQQQQQQQNGQHPPPGM